MRYRELLNSGTTTLEPRLFCCRDYKQLFQIKLSFSFTSTVGLNAKKNIDVFQDNMSSGGVDPESTRGGKVSGALRNGSSTIRTSIR